MTITASTNTHLLAASAVSPLSSGQKGIWLHQQQAPHSTVYHTSMALHISSAMNVPALQRALQSIYEQQDTLRTVIDSRAGEPVQRISESNAVAFTHVDASGWHEDKLRAVVKQSHEYPYDLANGPLFRVHLFTQSQEEHLLLMGAHHLIVDAASWLYILTQLRELYPLFSTNSAAVHADPVHTYAEFVSYEQMTLERQSEKLRKYWLSQLSDLPTHLSLPTDCRRPASQRFHGASAFFTLSPELTSALLTLAKEQKVTLYVVLLAAYQLLLHRYTRQACFAVGVPAANRPSAFGATIGNFVNILPLRADFVPNGEESLTVIALLRRVWKTLMTGLRNQAYPLAQLVKDLAIPHDPSTPPLVQALFSFPQSAPELAPFLLSVPGDEAVSFTHWGDLSIAPYGLQQQDGGFDLGLEMVYDGEGCVGVFKYNSDLFHPSTIERMINHFRTLLGEMVASPQETVSNLSMLTEIERRQILTDWASPKPLPPSQMSQDAAPCIHQLFEAQVERTPDAVAVVVAATHLTYKDLNSRANQLAHCLIRHGVGPERLVGVCMERSVEMVVAVLAVLKAGGAYVPLDPTYPQERLQWMLDDADVAVLLTTSHTAATIPPKVPQLNVEGLQRELAQNSTANPLVTVGPDNLAYCIFTSGSTGKPKGVLVEHRGVPNLTRVQIEAFGLHAGSRVLQFASFSFDAFVSELFTTLLAGAQFHLADADSLLVGDVLYRLLQERQITAITLPPSVLATLPPYHFETLVVAGEACPPPLAAQWFHRCGRLINAYGPTEATVCATMHHVVADDLTASTLPIGVPIDGAYLYILDAERRPAPIGVPGELYIGGIGVARGYLDRPELSAEKFISNPYAQESGDRLYRSGDLCRWLPNGDIEFMGRIDHQVKIRGFRIELSEIENALLAQDGVREAVVLVHHEVFLHHEMFVQDEDAKDDGESAKRLVAYVVGDPNTADRSMGEMLRVQLSQHLPEYMIPAAFVMLDAMPLTPNGKLDRSALPAPDFDRSESDFVAPRNRVETVLADAFAATLRIPRVGIHDNFFALGGDSIMSIGVVSRVAQAGYVISVNDLFQKPTVAKLAAVVHANDEAGNSQSTASQTVQTGDAPLLPIQRWFLDADQPEMHHFNQTFLLKVKQQRTLHALDPAQLGEAIATLLSHHDALRFHYAHDAASAGWRQTYGRPNASDPFQVIDLPAQDPQALAAEIKHICADLQTTLNPLAGDLVRFVYFRTATGTDDHLLIAIHHLAVDGVSWRILLEDLNTLLDGEQLPPKTSSYREWGEALQSATRDGRFDADIPRWLDGADATPLPLDAPNEVNTLGNSRQLTVSLSTQQTEHLLRTLPDRHDISLDALLLTALTETLTAWSGQDRLHVQMESHGRHQLFETLNLNRTVGWFTSAFPLTLPRVDGGAVKRIRQTLEQLRRVPDGGLRFGALQYFHPDAAIRQQLTALPVAPVVYNYLGQLDALTNARFDVVADAAGLSASPALRRSNVIDCNALILDGRLRIEWTVGPQIHHETAERLLASFVERIGALIHEALTSTERILIPSDFPDADIAFDQLEELFSGANADVETILGLSPMQAGMLFHSQMTPNRGAYIEHELRHVNVRPQEGSATFDVDRFVDAMQQVINRHDSLRASFHAHDSGEPLQVIHKQISLPVTRFDWRNVDEETYRQRLSELVEADRLRDFDLDQAPLLRLAIIERSSVGYDLLFTFHHILMDRWSVNLFWAEVEQVYAGHDLAQTPPFQHYIHHLRRQSSDRNGRQEPLFWQNYLRGFSAPTPLPGAGIQTGRHGKPASVVQTFSHADTQRLTAFVRRHELTLSTLFQATWGVLLARYARENDVIFGMVTSGRTSPIRQIESIVGLLINTLPFRIRLDDTMTGSTLLQQVAQTQLELQQRDDSALVDIQRMSELPSGTGLFESLWLFQNTPQATNTEDRLDLRPGKIELGDTGYPLVVLVTPGERTLLTIGYDTARYDEAVVRRLLDQWQQLMFNLVEAPDQPVLQLSMLSAAEYNQTVHEWNATKVDFGEPQTIHALFEAQVAQTPEAAALVFEDEQVTYAELNARANQLAHHLVALGVQTDTVVAVVMERSPELVVSLLAVLKAGGAYVPIDPTYPSERIRYMLADSAAPILLTQSRFVAEYTDPNQPLRSAGAQVTVVDGVDAIWAVQPTHNLQLESSPAALAYVIYTSGSTGQPKGVAVPHENLFNLIMDNIERFSIAAVGSLAVRSAQGDDHDRCRHDDRYRRIVMHAPTFGFDVEVGDLFMTLCAGATLYLPGPEKLVGSVLGDHLRRSQATHVSLTPAALATLTPEPYPNLQMMIVAGEALPDALAQSWLPYTAVWNAYGPTENTIYTTATECKPGEKVHIGKPLANVTAYILDEQLNPVPIGVAGELYTGGVHLARGYLNKPALTAKRFIHHPQFGRLYKTGDLCRWLPDGNIDYLGRTDFQVKIRGFRIELGEIESALLAQMGVHEALVLAREDNPGDKRLVAYVVGNADAEWLRQQLAQRLPDYMIPTAFIRLDAMPLNANGKIDRRALPAPDYVDNQKEFVPPRNNVEAEIAEIWRSTLQLEQVGVYDNFFDLGGHSLLATRVVSQIIARFQVDIPLRMIFDTVDLAELAKIVAVSTNQLAIQIEFDEEDEEF